MESNQTDINLPCIGGDEEDVLSGWRKVLHFRSGECKKVKRKYNKRLRKHANRNAFDIAVDYVMDKNNELYTQLGDK